MAQTILYYPQINIKDGAWLRNALLYWDEISSIVPNRSFDDISPELSYLRNVGVYHPVYPSDLFCSEFADDFCNCIIKRISYNDRLMIGKNGITRSRPTNIRKNKIYAPALYDLVHCSKMPPKLRSFFEEKGWLMGLDADGWMKIDEKIAQIYMRTLAEYSIKCSDKDIVLGTDSATHNQDIYRRAFCGGDSTTRCCKINIEKCLPQPAMDVSFEDILCFKDRRRDELLAFRAKIRELETNIYHADSPELIKHYETSFIEGWKQCFGDFYRVLKESKIKFYLSSLVSLVAIPFVGQFLSQSVGPTVASAVQTGAPLVSIGIGYFDYKNKISAAKADGGFSYIIKANRDGIIHI